MFKLSILDSGVTSASAGGGTPSSPVIGAPPSGDGGNVAPNSSPPTGNSPPDAGAVAPEVVPYNLSILSKIPVFVITVGVALSSSPTALSILCCCRSSLTSSSDQPKICFLAQVDDVA